ncbi:GAF and ANTAR domain-containing protein [Antribacter sp. KLBMP9083]|uniref:GAF and ANTAR domain-containing protein n=1 Tax=Antribacter soli TaxID=2910976 RepID=A0AA41U9D7_9MICO|nr:GAF and ANTAR domain-containing protein [Antribacter soli]MCF4121502.1 GAF and ANTAR domain-containing protein [Antribacter soli]
MAISSYPHEFAIRAATVLGSKIEASITVRQHGLTVRAGSSTDAAARCDQVEAMAGAGPCIDAMDQVVAQIVPEIASESRWEAWRTKAAEEGFTSALAVPALVTPGVAVALNLYSRSADPWTAELLTAADAYAHLTASAVRLRFELAEVEDAAIGVYRTMSETIATERAVGAIMQTNQCTEEDARRILDSAARNRSVTRREVAETILRALVVPDEGPGAAPLSRGS